MGFPENVQGVLLQRLQESSAYRKVDRTFRERGYQQPECRTERRTRVYCWWVEGYERRRETENADELSYRLSWRNCSKLVSWTRNCIGQRWGGKWCLWTWRISCCSEKNAAMVSPCKRLCSTLAGWTRHRKVERFYYRNSEELDWSLWRYWGSIRCEG